MAGVEMRRTGSASAASASGAYPTTDFATTTGSTPSSPSRARAPLPSAPHYGEYPPPYAAVTSPAGVGGGSAGSHGLAGTTSTPALDQQALAVPVQYHSSFFRPRVAVVLGISTPWQYILFVCRLTSIGPGVWHGLPCFLRLLVTVWRAAGGSDIFGSISSTRYDIPFETSLRITETLLATIWCIASSYLSFFFTDSLMSRWLLNYTPQATVVRLLTVSAINGWCTWVFLYLTGGPQDPRLLLPGWIVITTTLTLIYHLTQRKINIRKETRASISAFSIASFISMVALLAQLHSNRSDYPDIPIVVIIKYLCYVASRLALKIMEYGNVTRDL
ncbi:N-glycosylation protein-domain-containing protein [Podospora australis]|uniref:N-glycosylation protein-domain-containing protein n=1 Tax=Podospora australis TaxID=1536484 RepID=A0AAN6WVY3_9PEZI|nr:N-glycosylation protein-domain-containing protein [Podospora australis]